MKAVIVIGKNYKFNRKDFEDSFVIGVDKGAVLCYKNNVKMDIAIGDFDSITEEELKLLKTTTKVIELNPIKDETDTLKAIQLCDKYDDILILGGIKGDRIEHFYANLLILKAYPNVKMKDDNSFIFTTNNTINLTKSEYKFISIFSLDKNTFITLEGFKYPLNCYNLTTLDTIGISNEIIENNAKIKIHSGQVLIIKSKDDSK